MQQIALSNQGFILIRNILTARNNGGQQMAKEIAEALHNLPENMSNTFLVDLTKERIKELVIKYPECESLLAHL
jgi:hypothetical protein